MSDTLVPGILNLIRQGDKKAIKQVKKPLKHMTYRIFKAYGIKNHMLVKEIVNEVIAEIFSRRKPFDETKNVPGYLYQVTRNLINRHLRDRIPRTVKVDESDKLMDITSVTDSNMTLFEVSDAIDYCLGLLGEKERMLIEGLLNEEPAEWLKESLGYKNVEVLYSRKSTVVAKFKKLLRTHGVDI